MPGNTIRVWIPATMRVLAGGQESVEGDGENVRQLIENLESSCPGIKAALMNGSSLKPDVAVAVDGQICPLGLLQSLEDAREVTFIPALGGG